MMVTPPTPVSGTEPTDRVLRNQVWCSSQPDPHGPRGDDTVTPTPPSIAQLDKLLYRRAPWGDAESVGAKRFRLRSMANGTVEPGATVIAWDDVNTAGTNNYPAASFVYNAT